MTAEDARQNAQIAQLDNRALRAETLIRQLQGTAAREAGELRVVSELPALGEPGRMVLFAGSVWVDTGGAWKKLAFTEEVTDGTEAV
jgi:hypothetical protein